MPKIKPGGLDGIAEKMKRTMLLREGGGTAKVIVHMGTCGIAAGARTVMKALMGFYGVEILPHVLPNVVLSAENIVLPCGPCSCSKAASRKSNTRSAYRDGTVVMILL